MKKSDVMRLVRRLLATTLKRISDGSGSPLDTKLHEEVSRLMYEPECFADAPKKPIGNGERVEVVAKPDVTDEGVEDDLFAGQHGVIDDEREDDVPMVQFDSGYRTAIARKNLRRERPDERPDEKKPDTIRVGEYPFCHDMPREKKPEPPPRKFEDGQWVDIGGGSSQGKRGRILRAEWVPGREMWLYHIPVPSRADWTSWDYEVFPCPPPLSDAQRRLQPGDRVRVKAEGYNEFGNPHTSGPFKSRAVGAILSSRIYTASGVIECSVRLESTPSRGEIEIVEFLHNLDPAEDK